MITASVKIQRNRMRELSKQGQKAAARRNLEIANEAAKVARQLVPVDTGALKASIRVEANGRTGSAVLLAGNEKVDYAQFIEWGTSRAPAQPFITPAMESAAKQSRNRRITMYR